MSEDARAWCFLFNGDQWEVVSTRGEAIALALEAADAHRARLASFEAVTKTPTMEVVVAKIGRAAFVTNSDIVAGLGHSVRELLSAIADDLVGHDAAADYPDMKAEPFDETLEKFVLDWLEQHASEPGFFQVEDEEVVT